MGQCCNKHNRIAPAVDLLEQEITLSVPMQTPLNDENRNKRQRRLSIVNQFIPVIDPETREVRCESLPKLKISRSHSALDLSGINLFRSSAPIHQTEDTRRPEPEAAVYHQMRFGRRSKSMRPLNSREYARCLSRYRQGRRLSLPEQQKLAVHTFAPIEEVGVTNSMPRLVLIDKEEDPRLTLSTPRETLRMELYGTT